MAQLIKGITVTLYERTQTGQDAFGAAVYTETPTPVENVLVTPLESSAVVGDLQMQGAHAVYELCLPKGDAHDWEGCRVDFFGQSWRVCGFGVEFIPENVPLCWNRKVKVERYG